MDVKFNQDYYIEHVLENNQFVLAKNCGITQRQTHPEVVRRQIQIPLDQDS
jgi:hypothetical protein